MLGMDVRKIVKELGGTGAVAAMCGIQPPSVSEWIGLNKIPKARLDFLRLVRPEVFADCDLPPLPVSLAVPASAAADVAAPEQPELFEEPLPGDRRAGDRRASERRAGELS
jgi:hypothetical protein